MVLNKWQSNKENRIEKLLVTKVGKDNLPVTYLLSVLSAWNAEFVTYPLELVKTRLQIQGEAADEKSVKGLQNVKKRGMIRTVVGIIKEEGLFKLWHGIQAALLRHSVYSGTRIMVYKRLRDEFTKNGTTTVFPLWQSLICTTGACSLAQIIANPADLAKTQLQMEGKRRAMGLTPRVHGVFHAFREVTRKSGYSGLWKGTLPSMQRAVLVGVGDITAYDVTKHFILNNTQMKDGPYVHVIGSVCAGFVGAAMGTPADVIKTRIMNQPLTEDGRGKYYKGSFDCLTKAIKEEGVMSLYKGFVPSWIRFTPWALTFWITYEQYSKMFGYAQF